MKKVPSSTAQRAMNLSLAVGLLMLVGKVAAWLLTGSAAILSDAAESVIHVVAVAFAAFSLRLSRLPASERFQYGYERISFFSAGFEGSMIAIAAVGIIWKAVAQWRSGIEIRELSTGTLIVVAAALINLVLGWYLIRIGRSEHNLILEANGRHVLTDSWTSFGVIGGLVLVLLTGWKPFDPICAILLALQILYSGVRLMAGSIRGLLDYADPELAQRLNFALEHASRAHNVSYHEVRFRHTGQRMLAVVHLLFPSSMPIGEAHRIATQIEDEVARECGLPIELVTHLESAEDHALLHDRRVRAE